MTVGSPAVNYHEEVSVVDANRDGLVTVSVNTYRAGSTGNGTGIAVGHRRNAEPTADELGAIRRFAPQVPLSKPLDVADYSLEASVGNETTDLATLRVENRSIDGARTLVAPASASLETPTDVSNWTSERTDVAIGDQTVVAIDASGLGGFLEDGTDLRRGSAAAATSGAFVAIERTNPPQNQQGRQLNVSNAETIVDRENDIVYLIVPTDGGPYSFETGAAFAAEFVLNETSPFVPGKSTPNVVERETAATSMAFETPAGRFSESESNETIEIPASATATIAGETNVAPGTNVTVTVESDDENVTFLESETSSVEDDGSFESDLDMESYPEGTNVTVVASANGDELTEVRSGMIVESAVAVNASLNMTATGGGGSGASVGGETVDEVDSTTTASTTVQSEEPTDSDTDSVEARARRFVMEDVPEFIATQATNIVLILGAIALLYGFLGIRRLIR